MSKSLQEWACFYHDRGYQLVEVDPNTKKPSKVGWPDRRPRPSDFSLSNIGLVMGEGSGGLVCVNVLDDEEFSLAADALPGTGMRAGGLFFYRVTDLPRGYTKTNLAGLEIRGNRHFVVVPPSTVKGKIVRWEYEACEPGEVRFGDLLASAETLAYCLHA